VNLAYDILGVAARRFPADVALIGDWGQLTFEQLETRVASVTAGLERLGVRPGDRVGYMMNNLPEIVVAYFAILRLGAIAVAVNVMLRPVELAYVLGDSGARVLVCEPSVAQTAVTAKDTGGLKLNFGSAGVGGLDQLASALFKLETGVEFTVIPYKGSAPVMTALLSGEVDSSFTSLVPGIPHVKAGRLRALAVTTPKRSRALPDVPTIGETVPGYDVTHWYGMWGPKGIPREIAMRWNREVAKVLNTDTMKKWLEREGLELAGGPPEEFFDRIRSDTAKWKKVVKEAKIVIPK